MTRDHRFVGAQEYKNTWIRNIAHFPVEVSNPREVDLCTSILSIAEVNTSGKAGVEVLNFPVHPFVSL